MPPRAGCIRAAGWWPATRVVDPVFGSITVGLGQPVIAAVLAAVVLITRGERLIVPTLLPRLGIVVLRAVIGFPLLTTLALQNVTSAHAVVVSGLLPAATAGMAVACAGERPRRQYWLALVIGLAAVLGFAAIQGAGRPRMADLLVLAAVVLAGFGFADGATLAREYGGWRVICWALVLTLPVLLPITVISVVLQPPVHVTIAAVLGLGYVSVISMSLAFFAWYAGLALGGVARVGRLQLVQPALTLGLSALVLGEHISLATGIAAVIVLAVVVVGRKARVDQILPDRAVAAEPIHSGQD